MKKLLLFAFSVSAFAQTPPDCIASFNLTPATPTMAAVKNQGCIFWNFAYTNFGYSALSVTLQQAPDSNGFPGTWKTFAGTGESGSNPGTSITGAYYTIIASATDLAAWVRVTSTGTSGSSGLVSGFIFGYKTFPGASGGGGGGGGCTAPCVVIGPDAPGAASTHDPVQVAGNDGTDVRSIRTDTSGRSQVVGAAATGAAPVGAPVPIGKLDHSGNIIIPNFCNAATPISLSTVTGENQIIALSGSTVIRICNIAVGMTAAATVSIDVGTGSNCGTGTTTVWGPYPANTTGFTEDFSGVLVIPAGNAVCLNFGGTVTAGGGVSYAQY